MKALALDLRRGLAGPEFPRFLPFAAFIALMALNPWLSGIVSPAVDPRWLYALRAGVAGGLLIWLWPRLGELVDFRDRRLQRVANRYEIGEATKAELLAAAEDFRGAWREAIAEFQRIANAEQAA